jgi:hypothetical protein
MGIALDELRAAVDAFVNAANEGGSAPLPTILRR